MCGITGYFDYDKKITNPDLIFHMIKKLHHRGPDDSGVWENQCIALGHARLSIHDLSQAGHQPMFSFNRQWIIVFNGEIYNFLALRIELLKEENIVFSGNSDTEVLINAIAVWGVLKTLQKCIGMFAFAAYHILDKKLYLARDRFGEKPLYYGLQNNIFGFSSELKALKTLSAYGWRFDIDRDVLATYVQYSYVPTPYSIYKNIKKLEVGSYLEIDCRGDHQLHFYWQAKSVFSQSLFSGSYEMAVDLLEEKLKDSLKLQMIADVPIGAFLSGGIDSSTIVALMQSLSSKKINTFSIGFHEKEFNEAHYAKAVAKHLGTNHTEMYVTEADALNVIPMLSNMYDEPFADPSEIPAFLVSQIAKSQVLVSLSGDAGDELFGGYQRYFLANTIKSRIMDKPLLESIFSSVKIANAIQKTSSFYSLAKFSDKFLKLHALLKFSKRSPFFLYQLLCSQIIQDTLVLDGKAYSFLDNTDLNAQDNLSYQEWMVWFDANTYLIDNILTKVDRAAMAVSLETRIPFLDHRIFEFAWSLPLSYKIHAGKGKRILRDVLYRYVPKQMFDRKKMGFGIPLAKWLRQDLRPWAENLLDPQKMLAQGFLNVNVVQQYWQEHVSGKRDWKSIVWNILLFQAWLEQQGGGGD